MTKEDNRYLESIDMDDYKRSRIKKAGLIAQVLLPYINGRDTIVDLGGGTGIIASELSRIWGKDIIVLERDMELLNKGSKDEDSVKGDLSSLPFRDEGVDLFIVNHVWEHLDKPHEALLEIIRSLKRDGIVYLTLGNRLWLIEPHFKLPFLSLLPKPIANKYLSLFHPDQSYDGINFPFPWQVLSSLKHPSLEWRDITLDILTKNTGQLEKRWWRIAGECIKPFSGCLINPIWFYATPQWFFIGRKIV